MTHRVYRFVENIMNTRFLPRRGYPTNDHACIMPEMLIKGSHIRGKNPFFPLATKR
jgi:hypothetical protein